MTDLTNTTIRGYEFREQIGAGGFGAVYRASQPIVGREVAIKVILPEYANEPDFVRRFETEAQLVARLEHPHIVPLFDYWREPSGAYLVMRFLRGGSLRGRMDNGQLSVEEVARYLDQIAGALAVAHRGGVVHRDIKPQNILLDEDNQNAYLTDFGIAKVLGEGEMDENADEEGISGSPAYFAPEQIRSEPITAKTDIYGLGVILYELLTGDHPFPDSNISELIFKHLQDPLPDVTTLRAELPPEVNEVIQKATAKNPDARYPDVLALATAFRQTISSQSDVYGMQFEEIDYSMVANPYKGLRPFDEADAADFFGREVLISQLLKRLSTDESMNRFLAVVGPSGSGKSSVVKAGLIPALRWGDLPGSENWFVAEMMPGVHPLKNLAEALLGVALTPPANLQQQLEADPRGLLWAADAVLGATDGDLLLIVDQFEEIFTLAAENEAEREQFLKLIAIAVTHANSRVRVIVTLRADFMDRPLQYPEFGALMRQRTEFVLPLTPDEIERAVTGPADRVGLIVNPALLAAIVADVRQEPGALPLLQYALTEVFERRDGALLTLEGYQASGGVLGALARRAEELYAGLAPNVQAAARQVLLRLVALGEGTENTRRRAAQSELAAVTDATSLQTILSTFGAYRLLSFDRDPITREPTVEVAHEALIREWKRLREWLENGRADLRMQRLLSVSAADWRKSNNDASFLLTGSRLEQFEEWAQSTDLALTADERAYLNASLDERVRRDALERERIAHEQALEQRSRNFLRALAVVLFIAAVGALGLSAFAFQQRGIADQERIAADQARSTSDSNAIAAQNAAATAETALIEVERGAVEARSIALAANARQVLDTENTDLALALALEAVAIPNPPERVRNTLAQAAYAPGTRHVYRLPLEEGQSPDTVSAAAITPDGQRFITSTQFGILTLWDAATGAPLKTQQVGDSGLFMINDIAITSQGRFALLAALDGSVHVWDIENWQEIGTLCCHENQVAAVAASPDGKFALSGPGSQFGNVVNTDLILWNITTGEQIRRFSGHTDETQDIVFSPDGQFALSASGDDFEATGDNVAILWNIETGEEVRRFTVHTDRVNAVAFSPDGTTALTGSIDENLILWDVATGEEIRRFVGSVAGITSIAFSNDGATVIAATIDGSIRAWDTATGTLLRRYLGHAGQATDIAVVPATETASGSFISSGTDGDLRLWAVSSGAELRVIKTDQPQRVAVYSPDGKTAVVGSLDGTLTLWNTEDWTPVFKFGDATHKHTDTVLNIAFSPDGQKVLVGDFTGAVIEWDTTTGAFIRQFEGHEGTGPVAVAYSPDGTRIATTLVDTSTIDIQSDTILWDAVSGQVIWRSDDYDGVNADVEFTPDGQRLLVGSYNVTEITGELVIHNAETGEILERLKGHTDGIYGIAVSPDGTQALTTSGDFNVILWDISESGQGRALRRLIGHTNLVQNARFSADGRYALTAGWDKTARLWNLATGEQILSFDGHADRVRSVVFSPDGTSALSAGMDNTLRVWQMPLDGETLTTWTHANRYVRDLTCDERLQYSVEPLCE